MTVTLLGVGADQTNSSPYPQIYEGGSFEYVPIPEAYESSESGTFGTISRKPNEDCLQEVSGSEDTLSDVLDEIKPREGDGDTVRGENLKSQPIHWDPNFSDYTYGEVKTANKNQIKQLNPDQEDVLAFYTGLAFPGSETPHRYIIGYFTVDSITDFRPILGDCPPKDHNDRVVVSELPHDVRETVESNLNDHPNNAHVKRYKESGTIHPELLIVDGKRPGGLLNRAYRISQTVPGGHAFTEDAEERLMIVTTATHRETGFLGGFKKAHRSNLRGTEFIEMISR